MPGFVRVFLIALMLALGSLATSGRAAAAELRIDFKELSALASSFLSDASIRLHNAQSGVLDFSAGSSVTIAGAERPIPVPVRSFEALGLRFAYLINDLNSKRITLTPATGAVRLSIVFEDEGPELIGRCLSDLCPPTAALPEIEWQNAAVNIDLVPAKAAGGLALKAERVEVLGVITPRCKAASFFARSLCNAALPKARATIARLKRDLDTGLAQQVNAAPIQEKIANALKGYMKLGKAGEVVVSKVSVENGGRAVVVSFCLSC